ncbi:hypothetical protein BO78DRAFT_322534 [Aspergillus sclerotiicarbonarius CBS 121057]|uniref:Heterokaryon incompatibility domain-containing protein n=1 Tax=Aspergillus sclerotiicarbonarius (strain CBS 121057 / IBT 28362) TaxID=1448318 RepID=A0A319FBQ5_ASPSB|nr:hypothetical protein BO78DRAFT_322534 [Aspergillus sclerotiicarbonarius CBS 121057]
MSFQYGTLDPEVQQIRLLCIHPSQSPQSPMQCSLQTVSLKHRPKFEALSYVWGTNHAAEQIFLEGSEFNVTPNLAKALYALRDAYLKRTMWIDYICINQSDIEEKNTQVPLMGSIYGSADGVVSWLGDASPAIERAVTWVERCVDRKTSTRALYWSWLSVKSVFSTRATVERINAQLAAMQGVFEIATVPYWSRKWTYQECLLAKQEPTFVCGHLAFKASKVLEALSSMTNINWDEMKLPQSQDERALVTAALAEHDNYLSRNNINMIAIYLDRGKTRGVPLTLHLYMTIQRQCQNPRDRIYALYGLCPDIQKVHPQDYNKAFETITLETTTWLIKNDGAGGVLSNLPFSVHNVLKSSLPTWVPDYQGDFSLFFKSYSQNPFMDHRENEEYEENRYVSHICEDLLTLHLWAYRAGICKVVVQFVLDPCKTATQIMEVFENMEELWSEHGHLSLLQERFIEAFKIFYYGINKFSTKEILEGVQTIGRSNSSEEGGPLLNFKDESVKKYEMTEFLKLLGGNRLLFVHNAYGCAFGISPGVGEDQDILVVPHESHRPLILRSDSIADGDGGKMYYKVVGQAIVGDQEKPTSFSDGVKQQPLEEFLVV